MLRIELEARYDYSTYSAFKCVDKYNDGFISSFNLGMFLRNNGHHASERELLAIIRRIDTDGDAKISYSEFCDYIKGDSASSLLNELKTRSISEERNRRNL